MSPRSIASIRALLVALALTLLAAALGCGDDDSSAGGPPTEEFDIVVSEPRFIIPSESLPSAPSEDVVVQVIRAVIPAFHFALEGEELAFATDPTGTGGISFEDVVVTGASSDGAGMFRSQAADFAGELSAAGSGSGLYVRFFDAVWSGSATVAGLTTPIYLEADIAFADVVAATVALAGLDEAEAAGFIAGLFGIDPENPPSRLPVRAELGVEAL